MHRYAAKPRDLGAVRYSLSYSLLGLLIERASHAEELERRFDEIYGEDLPLDSPRSIPDALEELLERGQIERLPDARSADGRSDRVEVTEVDYRSTPKGISAYKDWLIELIEEERRRSWLLARQLAALEPEAALEVVDRYERECLEEASRATARPDRAGERGEGVTERLAREEERLGLGARLTWFEFARRELQAQIERRKKRATQQQTETP